MYPGGERVRLALRAVIAVFWDVVRSVTFAAGTTQVQQAFESTGLKCSSEVIPTPTPLCKCHYRIVYSTLQHRRCATCGVRLRGNNHRPCPKPDAIQQHLKGRTGFEGEIILYCQNRVCMSCYKSHLLVLKEPEQTISRDNDLQQLIDTYTQQIPPMSIFNCYLILSSPPG